MGLVCSILGLVLVCSVSGFFLKKKIYKHLCIGVCFAFALYRLYWGLVFSTSDVTMGLISDSLYWFFFFFFFFENPWVCYLCNLLDSPWAWLVMGLAQLQFFFFQTLVQIFFLGFFFFFNFFLI